MLELSNTGPGPDNQDTPGHNRAEELEAIIDKGKATFIEVGEALAELKELKLYKPRTWAEYVKERFGFTRQYAHRLIQAMEWAKEKMSTTVDIPETEHATWLAREGSLSAKWGVKTKAMMHKAMMNGMIATKRVPTLQPASKVIIDLDAEFQTFKATVVARWEKALSREDYVKLIEQAITYLEDLANEMEEVVA